jgi:hypothetical protein
VASQKVCFFVYPLPVDKNQPRLQFLCYFKVIFIQDKFTLFTSFCGNGELLKSIFLPCFLCRPRIIYGNSFVREGFAVFQLFV